MRSKVILDACVLFSKTLTDALLYPAMLDAFFPCWSGTIRDEWTRNLHAHQVGLGKDPSGVASRAMAMDRAFPDACIEVDRVQACQPAAEAIAADQGKPHPGDVHVLAAAMAAEADFIVTSNTGHFAKRVPWNRATIVRMTPDEFMTKLMHDVPDIVIHGFRRQILNTHRGPRSLEDIIERLADPQMMPKAAAMLTRMLDR